MGERVDNSKKFARKYFVKEKIFNRNEIFKINRKKKFRLNRYLPQPCLSDMFEGKELAMLIGAKFKIRTN